MANTELSNHFDFDTFYLFSALPDLVLDTDMLKRYMEMNTLALRYLQCAFEENCLSASAAEAMR